jgi:hypothetical protein
MIELIAVDHLAGARRQDRCRNRSDLAVADRDDADAIDLRDRANNAAAAQQEIIFRNFSHGAVCSFEVMPAL